MKPPFEYEHATRPYRQRLRESALDYLPDLVRAADLLRYYFAAPSDEQIDEIYELLKPSGGRRDGSNGDPFRNPVYYAGQGWWEEFGRGADWRTPSDALLELADNFSELREFPEPEMFCPPQFVGTWEQLEPAPATSVQILWHLFPDGAFDSNAPEFTPEHRWWSVYARGDLDDAMLQIRTRRLRSNIGNRWSARVQGDELTFELRGQFPQARIPYRFRRRPDGPRPRPKRPITVSGIPFHFFTLFIVVPRGLDETKTELEWMVGAELEAVADATETFETPVLGLDLRFARVGREPDGDLWRIDGDTAFTCPGMEKSIVRWDMVSLLRKAGFTKIYTPAMLEEEHDRRAGFVPPRVVVRSAEEANIYMDMQLCPSCGEWRFDRKSHLVDIDGALVSICEGDCSRCSLIRHFELELDPALPPPHTEDALVLGHGTSHALTAEQFVAFASRTATEGRFQGAFNIDAARRDQVIYRARLALAALDEAAKLAPDADLSAVRTALTERIARVRAGGKPLP